MKIIADENIPFLQEYFGDHELILKPGRNLTRDDVKEADALLLRSITKVDRDLLENTQVKFVGCVSTGIDHIDKEWLASANIRWCAAEGSNATGVVEYVISTLAALEKLEILDSSRRRAAVVGVGRIGSRVADKLRVLGYEVLLCDPIRAQQEKDFPHTPFTELKDLDFISLHTPLTKEGEFPTYHMVDKSFIQNQRKNTVILNAGRGSVIDFSDLKEYGERLYWCLDVWENEPYIDFEVLNLATIATPHIAGYTVQSKYRGIEIVYRGLFGHEVRKEVVIPHQNFSEQLATWQEAALAVYDPLKTTAIMKRAIIEDGSGKAFDAMRNYFQDRYEFGYTNLKILADFLL